MENKTLFKRCLDELGLTSRRLAVLTGQSANTLTRKARGDQGLRLGAREAGMIAALEQMDPAQRERFETRFQALCDAFEKGSDTGSIKS